MTRKLLAPLAVAAVALATAACGNAAYSSHGSSTPAAGGGSAAPANTAAADVGQSSLGKIIVDSQGHTLYLFAKDKGNMSTCYGACATYWPPALTSGSPAAGAGANASLLGVTKRTDGSTQLTYAGHPLYRYIADTQPGQIAGQGANTFGALWWAVAPSGAKITSGASGNSGTSGYSYGY
jgi:predicted lipoprotein with Yx(FWY)xxD motif